MTDCGASSELDRDLTGRPVVIIVSCRPISHVDPPSRCQHTVSCPFGLVIGLVCPLVKGEPVASSEFGSCESSSMSVLSVPLESVGEGSTCWG